MLNRPTYLDNFERVIDAYGYWPSFHDSPVLRFQVGHLSNPDVVELELEAWEMTSAVDDAGYFILTRRHHIGFLFSGLISTDLTHFIPDNILSALTFSSADDRQAQGWFAVELESAVGSEFCGRFAARWGAVTFVRPIPEMVPAA